MWVHSYLTPFLLVSSAYNLVNSFDQNQSPYFAGPFQKFGPFRSKLFTHRCYFLKALVLRIKSADDKKIEKYPACKLDNIE